jgi:hypothetical protein
MIDCAENISVSIILMSFYLVSRISTDNSMKKSSRKKSIGESLAAFLKCKVSNDRLGSAESGKSYVPNEKFDKAEKSRWSIPLPRKKNAKKFVDRGEQTDSEHFLR